MLGYGNDDDDSDGNDYSGGDDGVGGVQRIFKMVK